MSYDSRGTAVLPFILQQLPTPLLPSTAMIIPQHMALLESFAMYDDIEMGDGMIPDMHRYVLVICIVSICDMSEVIRG